MPAQKPESKMEIPAAFGATSNKSISPRPKIIEKKVEPHKPIEKKVNPPKPINEKKVEPASKVDPPKTNDLQRKSTKIEIPGVFGAASR